jgi:hypothetical protein
VESVPFRLSICPTKIVLAIPESITSIAVPHRIGGSLRQKAKYAAGCFWTVEPDCETEWKEG